MEQTNNDRALFPFGKPQVNWDGLMFLWLAILTASVIYLRPTGDVQDYSQAIAGSKVRPSLNQELMMLSLRLKTLRVT